MSDGLTFGWRVRTIRRENGLRLNDVAERSGVSTSYLSQLERGERTSPSVEVAQRIAKALHVSLLRLVGEQQADAPANAYSFGQLALSVKTSFELPEPMTEKQLEDAVSRAVQDALYGILGPGNRTVIIVARGED